eukprot:2253972-Amphidinium_carterae.1
MLAQGWNEEIRRGRLIWSWSLGTSMLADALTKVFPATGLAAFDAAVGLGSAGAFHCVSKTVA